MCLVLCKAQDAFKKKSLKNSRNDTGKSYRGKEVKGDGGHLDYKIATGKIQDCVYMLPAMV